MSPVQIKAKSVAAVYDRRMENKPGSHRQPLQEESSVVAAVCDRREESESDALVAQFEV
jgi:hypothetical protein